MASQQSRRCISLQLLRITKNIQRPPTTAFIMSTSRKSMMTLASTSTKTVSCCRRQLGVSAPQLPPRTTNNNSSVLLGQISAAVSCFRTIYKDKHHFIGNAVSLIPYIPEKRQGS